MEVNLLFDTEDSYIFPKNESLFDSLKEANSTIHKDSDFKIEIINPEYKKEINNKTTPKEILNNINNNNNNEIQNEISIKIKPSNETISLINSLLEKGAQQEKKFLELKNEINNLYLNTELNKDKLTKKLMSLLVPETEYYHKIIKSIAEIYLLLDETKKDLKIIENNLFHYKNCKLIILYFKIYSSRMVECVKYLYNKGSLFTSNEKNFSLYIDVYNELLKFVIMCANNEIKDLLMEKEIYKNHIQEYEELFNLINEMFIFLPIIRYFDMKTQKVVFSSFDDPINLPVTEAEYDIITEITNQMPKKDGLKVTLNNFIESIKKKQYREMAFKISLELYKHYKVLYVSYVYCSLLFDKNIPKNT